MLNERVAAIIIKNKKILLVTGYDERFYWTPGGKIERKESRISCLKRELFAELGVKLISLKYYATFTLSNEINSKKQVNHYYLVKCRGKIKRGQEITKTFWFSRQNFLDKKPQVSKGIEKKLIPKLINDGYL